MYDFCFNFIIVDVSLYLCISIYSVNKKEKKDRLIRDIRATFEQEEDYYKSERVKKFWHNNYIEYESHGDKNRKLSLANVLIKSNLTLGI